MKGENKFVADDHQGVVKDDLIKLIVEGFIKKIDKEIISYNDLSSLPIPGQVQRFLLEVVKGDLWTSSQKFDISYVDMSDVHARKEVDVFLWNVLPLTVFSRKDFAQLLFRAVRLSFQYLYSPSEIASKILFNDKDIRTGSDLLPDLLIFREYDYLFSVIGKYLSRSPGKKFSKQMFARLVDLIEIKLLEKIPLEKQAIFVYPFFSMMQYSGKVDFPVNVLYTYFKNRNAVGAVRVLDKFLQVERDVISFQELVNKFKLTSQSKEMEQPLAEDYNDIVKPYVDESTYLSDLQMEANQEEGRPQIVEQVQDKVENTKEKNLHDQEVRKERESGIEREVDAKKSKGLDNLSTEMNHDVKHDEPQDSNDDKIDDMIRNLDEIDLLEDVVSIHGSEVEEDEKKELRIREKSRVILKPKEKEEHPKTSLLDPHLQEQGYKTDTLKKRSAVSREALLKSYFSEKDKKRIVKKIFKRKESRYDDALEKLSTIGTWNDAISYIEKDVFDRHNVDIFCDEALLFTDKVHYLYLNEQL